VLLPAPAVAVEHHYDDEPAGPRVLKSLRVDAIRKAAELLRL
jgi:hypothetical protein